MKGKLDLELIVKKIRNLALVLLIFIGLMAVSLHVMEFIEFNTMNVKCPPYAPYDTSLNCCCHNEYDFNYTPAKWLGCWCEVYP